nr:hypothetical protein pKpNDM1_00272 [Raoultella planticola]QZX60378.1 hypothetical protein [Klebsiella michiganensis]UFD96478.1 hypothetical protein [Klebsiella oxytoca]UGK55330.1 Hypothetical protein [Raoultella ornithinolytica]UWX38407.1 hypothetical protein KK467_p0495 [Klebsiella pneumoniae]
MPLCWARRGGYHHIDDVGFAGGCWQSPGAGIQRKVTFIYRRILTLKCQGDYEWAMI